MELLTLRGLAAAIASPLVDYTATIGNKTMDPDLERVRAEILERIERVETTLLTEFHKWASATDARQRSHSAALRAFDVEMELLADRVKKLEGGQPGASG